LVGTSSSVPHSDSLSFSILTDIKNLLVVGIDEYCLGVSELLPPTSVGSPNLQSIGFSWVSNLQWLVVWLWSNGLWLGIEVPHLGVSSVGCLDNNISSDDIEVSAWSQSWDNVEISLNIKAEFRMEFSLGVMSGSVNIDDFPRNGLGVVVLNYD
jgi:hypothetical protein